MNAKKNPKHGIHWILYTIGILSILAGLYSLITDSAATFENGWSILLGAILLFFGYQHQKGMQDE